MAASENWFQAKVIALLCNWCACFGADPAGNSPCNTRPTGGAIRLTCSGAVDPVYVLKPLSNGADGVLIGGPHPSDCHHRDGNHRAQQRVDALKETLRCVGTDEDRVWLRWIAASEVEILKKGQK